MFNGLRIDGDLFDVLGIVFVTSCLQSCQRSIQPKFPDGFAPEDSA